MSQLRATIASYESANVEKVRPKTLISYVYAEGAINRRNLQFFIDHGLHESSHFVFSFNGDTDAYKLLPIYEDSPNRKPGHNYSNIEVLTRDNKCFDMGAHGEAFLREWDEKKKTWTPMTGHDRGGRKFWESFDRFILMNASVRGPFIPISDMECWMERFFSLISEKVKLVGMSYNCHGSEPGKGHVQSMVWALDRVGIKFLMEKPSNDGRSGGIGWWCPFDMSDAIKGELRGTVAMRDAGFESTSIELVAHAHDSDGGVEGEGTKKWKEECTTKEYWHENDYFGFNVHPYETVFTKAARDMQKYLVGNFTEWTDGSGYSSYERCDGRWDGRWKGAQVIDGTLTDTVGEIKDKQLGETV